MRCGHSDRSIHLACAMAMPTVMPIIAESARPVMAVRVLMSRAVNIRSRIGPLKSSNRRCGGGMIIGLPDAGEKLLCSEYATRYHRPMNTRNTATGPTALINLRFTMTPSPGAIERSHQTHVQIRMSSANLDRDLARMEC